MSIKRRKVLVLNKSWSAIRIVTLERAITLLFSTYKNGEPKAKIVDGVSYTVFSWEDWAKLPVTDDSEGIHTANQIFRIPEIIQLTRYNKIPTQKLSFSRQGVYKRDGGHCQYCGKKVGTDATLDHVLPKSRGGATSWSNVVISCRPCNFKKADRTPAAANMQLLKQPTVPSFSMVDMELKESDVVSWKSFVKA